MILSQKATKEIKRFFIKNLSEGNLKKDKLSLYIKSQYSK